MTEARMQKITHVTSLTDAARIIKNGRLTTIKQLQSDYHNFSCGFCISDDEKRGRLLTGHLVYLRNSGQSYLYSHKDCIDALLQKEEQLDFSPSQNLEDIATLSERIDQKIDSLLKTTSKIPTIPTVDYMRECIDRECMIPLKSRLERIEAQIIDTKLLIKGCHARFEQVEAQLADIHRVCKSLES